MKKRMKGRNVQPATGTRMAKEQHNKTEAWKRGRRSKHVKNLKTLRSEKDILRFGSDSQRGSGEQTPGN